MMYGLAPWVSIPTLVLPLMVGADVLMGVSAGAQVAPTVVAKGATPAVGDLAPSFRLKDLAGETVAFDQFRGVVVMVNFWATWCGPCRVEMPAMEALYQMFPRKDFQILAVSTDAQGAAVTRPFQQELKLTFPILHDADFHVARSYGAHLGLPSTFLVDRQGVIRHRIPGALDWQAPEAVSAVRKLIQEGQP